MVYTVEIQDTGVHRFCARAVITNGEGYYIGEVTWTQGYSFLDEAKTKAGRIATAHRFAASDDVLAQLCKAESFIAGFEGDEMQEGIDDLLSGIRAAINKANGA